jgi:hypothetical protein
MKNESPPMKAVRFVSSPWERGVGTLASPQGTKKKDPPFSDRRLFFVVFFWFFVFYFVFVA